jgi:hypothetical protein
MSIYYFDLLAGGQFALDREGTDLADWRSAAAHAQRVAREMMQHAELRTRHWRLRISDDQRSPIGEVLFASVDHSLDHLTPQLRESIEQVCFQYAELTESLAELTMVMHESRAMIARAHGKPFLAAIGDRRLSSAATL